LHSVQDITKGITSKLGHAIMYDCCGIKPHECDNEVYLWINLDSVKSSGCPYVAILILLSLSSQTKCSFCVTGQRPPIVLGQND